MFKLESYITPWLLSYIDQYVKLRREDFQLSLWGGDVVFYNLELRLANIQKLVPTLPIVFQSGIIHELRIHVCIPHEGFASDLINQYDEKCRNTKSL